MRRIVFALLLLAWPVAADRAEFLAARDALLEAYFDELDSDQRDRQFEALGTWDHPEVVKPLGQIASRYGTYLAGLEGQLATTQTKLDAFKGRTALTEQEIGLRNSYTRKIEKLELRWRRARNSSHILVKGLGSFRNTKTIQGALSQFEKHPTWRVRQLLASACGQWHVALSDAATSKKLFAALKKLSVDKEVPVRIAVVRAAAAFMRPEAFELMKDKLMNDTDWRVRASAVQSLRRVRTPEVVTALIKAMNKEKGRLKDDIDHALRHLTGENHQFADAWWRWWRSVGQRLPKKPTGDEAKPGDKPESSLKAKDSSRFYGIPTRSEHICFIIDVSGSMNKEVEEIRRVVITGRPVTDLPVEGKTRIEVARNELKRAITNLASDKMFNIIFFNHAIRSWQPKMEKATPLVKKRVRKDIEAVVASGTTYTLGALREAFTIAGAINKAGKKKKELIDDRGVDTIFLLSDGGPTDNRMEDPQPMEPDLILQTVKEWNRDAGIVIHTIAVDTEVVGTYFLKQLAAQNGGIFVERKK